MAGAVAHQHHHKGERLAALAAWAAPLAVYVATLLPSTGYSGDTAKFQYLGKVLGTPHPTGYPGYLLLNHLFVSIAPWGSVAWRANLLSAVCAAAACALIYRTLRLLDARPVAALAAAASFGFTGLFWSQAVVAEVYALNALYTAGVLCLLVGWERTGERRRLRAAALVFALSLGNHLATAMLAPGIAAFVWAVDRREYRNPRTLAAVGLALIIGAAQYGYLFWRSAASGGVLIEADVHGLRSLAACVSGSPFRAFMFTRSPLESFGVELPKLLLKLAGQYGPLLVPIAFGVGGIRPRRLWLLLGGGAGVTLLMICNYGIPDIDLYLIPVVLILALPLGMGIERALAAAQNRRRRGAAALALAASLLAPLLLLAWNWSDVDRSNDVADARRAEAVLDAVGPGSLIIPPDYATSCYLRYYLYGEDRRGEGIELKVAIRPGALAAYLRDGAPLTSEDGRLVYPPGLDLFVLDRERADLMRAAGCWAHELASGPILITPGPEPSPGRRARHRILRTLEPSAASEPKEHPAA